MSVDRPIFFHPSVGEFHLIFASCIKETLICGSRIPTKVSVIIDRLHETPM